MKADKLKAKQAEVELLIELIKDKPSLVLFNYSGLNAAQAQELRRNARKEGARVVIPKNTMLERAFAKIAVTDLNAHFSGPTALIVATDTNEMAPFKVLSDFAKTAKFIKVKAGMFDKNAVDANTIAKLATIPGRETLYSMIASVLQAPMRNMAYAIKQVAEQKETPTPPQA